MMEISSKEGNEGEWSRRESRVADWIYVRHTKGAFSRLEIR